MRDMGDSNEENSVKNNVKEAELNDDEHLCTKCNKDIIDESNGKFLIGCELCFKWFHIKCAKVAKKTYELVKNPANMLHWFCESCNNKSKTFLGQLELMINEQKALRSELDALKSKIDSNAKPTTDIVKQEVANYFKGKDNSNFPPLIQANTPQEEITKFLDTHVKPIISNTVSPIVSADMEEQRQIEKIKLNLVVSGIAESNNPDDDLQKVKDIIVEELEITPQIEKVERCGRIQKGSDGTTPKPRLLRVFMKDARNRKEILRKAPTLRNANDEETRENVYIRPDQTLKQQLDSKNLRDQLRRMKQEEPEKNYKIKRGKIVPTPAPDQD